MRIGSATHLWRTRVAKALWVLALLIGVAAWSIARRPDGLRRESIAGAAGSNVLLISIDTVRADHLSPYGYTGVDTPAIAQLAADGVTFREAFTPVPMTLPAHASIFTGLWPFHHGVRDNGGFRLPSDRRTLTEALKQAGYQTAAFVSAFVLDSRWGLARGFDEYVDRFSVSRGDLSAMARVQRPAADTWAAAKPWLQRHASERFFLWLHFYDPHAPYTPPEPFRTTYAARPYDGEIAYVDAVLAEVMQDLRARGVLEHTIVVLLSDHGEGLGEHEEDEHGLLTYDSTLRVPWIVRLPGRQFAGRVVDQPVDLVDVYPTILDLLALPAASGLDGVSRARLLQRPGTGGDALYAESYYPRLRFNWNELTGVRIGGLKYVRSPQPELYDYRQDPGETTNLASTRPDAVARLDGILTRAVGSADQVLKAPTTDTHSARELQALGYVSGSSAPPSEISRLPNPVTKTGVYRRFMQAQQQLELGRDREGLASLEAVLTADPELNPAHRTLREFWISRQRFDEAAVWIGRQLSQHPDVTALHIDLAAIEQAAGRLDRASAAIAEALRRQPANPQALSLSGEIQRAAGKFDTALDAFTRAAAQSPDVPARMQIAQTLFAMGRLGDADVAVRAILQEDASAAGAHYLLAQIAYARRDAAAAEQEYAAEIGVSPWDYRARFNLAALLGSEGRRAEQIAQLQSIPAIAPEFGEVHFHLAKALFDTGDPARFDDAIAEARRGLAAAPHSPTAPLGYYVIADIFRVQGRGREADAEMAAGRALERRLETSATPATNQR